MILITGATGHLGKFSIDYLLKKNTPTARIAALIRNPEKAEDLKSKGVQIRLGSYDDYNTLISAFKGVDKLLFISGSEITIRDKQHENVVNAAKEAGVKHIVYTSVEYKDAENIPPYSIAPTHIKTEKMIKASGLSYTFMQNNLYLDALPTFIGNQVLETGIILPAGEGKGAYATRQDIAEATANILISNNHENKAYKISNSANYSFEDIANVLSKLSGKKVTYTSPDKDTYVKALTGNGIPEMMALTLAGMANSIKQNEFMVEHSDLEMLLGRKPTTLEEFLKAYYSL